MELHVRKDGEPDGMDDEVAGPSAPDEFDSGNDAPKVPIISTLYCILYIYCL